MYYYFLCTFDEEKKSERIYHKEFPISSFSYSLFVCLTVLFVVPSIKMRENKKYF